MVQYRVEITAAARQEIKALPGNMRQRILRLLKDFQQEPRPTQSIQMDTSGLEIVPTEKIELYRVRIESWRVIYAIEAEFHLVTVLGIRKRPPYQYEDLQQLLDDS